jgi:anti-sigma B factor antagonist
MSQSGMSIVDHYRARFIREDRMETAIGVFTSRNRAEEAINELRRHLPEDAIVFLTRSEHEAAGIGSQLGILAGGAAGGAILGALLVPGLGPVFVIGAGAAALLGLATAIDKKMDKKNEANVAATAADEKVSEDAAFFREVLKDGRSLIVVRTESKEAAASAVAVLDRLGLGMRNRTPVRMQVITRVIGDIAVLDISGRITVGEGNIILREIVRELVDQGSTKIVLDLSQVQYIDSSGIGELVKTHTTVRNQGGQLKLVNLNRRVTDLLQMTKLAAVFDIEKDESSAIKSLGGEAA